MNKQYGYLTLAALMAGALAVGCGNATSNTQGGKPAGSDHHDHDGHEHGEHEHADEHGHVHTGAHHKLGTKTFDDRSVSITQIGELEAGKECVLDVDMEPATGATLRAWISLDQNSAPAGKAKLDAGGHDLHVAIPSPLAPGAKLWVEVEAGGKKTNQAFELHHKS